jgi:hypothetical protein
MKHLKHPALFALAALIISLPVASAQTPPPTPAEVGKILGFSPAEITQIENGEIVSKDLKEVSDKELAGVVAVYFKKPVGEILELAMQARGMRTDEQTQAFHSWTPDDSADEAFAKLSLAATETDEAELFAKASAGSKLNLSAAEIKQFNQVPGNPAAVSVQLRKMLQSRYEAYRKSGLGGVAPYDRGGGKTASPAHELTQAIKEMMTLSRRDNFFQSLLDYPAKPMAGVEHRFFWIKREVESRPTFILAQRSSIEGKSAALVVEEQFYVGHSYNANFMVAGALEVKGGSLVFHVNRTFTDQVAGFGSGMKHSIGRAQMLDEIEANLKRARDQFQK